MINQCLVSWRKQVLTGASFCAGLLTFSACGGGNSLETNFEISFSPDLHAQPVTGRVYVLISKDPEIASRRQRSFGHQPVGDKKGDPFFATNVDGLNPNEAAIIDSSSAGFPLASLKDLPPGDYYVQALLNIYTRFERADGHVIWAHMDQWEGQRFNISPGNLLSGIQRLHLDPAQGFTVRLKLNQVIPPVQIPADTKWVKRVKIRSQLLSNFWGHPIDIGATLLLPRGYDEQTGVHYPAIYYQGHFSLDPPFGFSTEPVTETETQKVERLKRNLETGYQFYESWTQDNFPRLVAITFQHPTPYFDDSYTVNSANSGPYADALLQELVPYLEEKFRLIPEGYARVLTGGSTGGYEALALQVHHPRFFGGTWVFYPDPIDFRRYFMINIYQDENAFRAPGYELLQPRRYSYRAPDGQPLQTVEQLTQLHAALGTRGRSCEYLEAWEASFGPTDEWGYPRPLWDRETGQIDREVAHYWRDNGYDLSYYLKKNWSRIGKNLASKIRVYCGDMDHYYFNLAVYGLEEILEATTDPTYGGSFEYGRPEKGHGWRPMSHAQLVHQMARHIAGNAPRHADKRWLR